MRYSRAMRHIAVIAVCGVLTSLACFGCNRLSTGAREQFATTYSCPEDRVEVKSREDLKWGALVLGARNKEAPPAEIAQDPGRLAKWQSDQEEKSKSLDSLSDKVDVYQVTGCGHDVLMGCWRSGGGRGGGSLRVSCQEHQTKP